MEADVTEAAVDATEEEVADISAKTLMRATRSTMTPTGVAAIDGADRTGVVATGVVATEDTAMATITNTEEGPLFLFPPVQGPISLFFFQPKQPFS